jgi:hypothetical protein
MRPVSVFLVGKNRKKWQLRLLWRLVVLGLALPACSGAPVNLPVTVPNQPATPNPAAPATPTPFQPLPPTPTITPEPSVTLLPTAIPPIPVLWLAPYLPETLRNSLVLPAGVSLAQAPEPAYLHLVAGEAGALAPLLSRWVYALVAPFPTIAEGVSAAELRQAWQGEAAGPFAGQPLLMESSTRAALVSVWGEPGAGAVQVLPGDELVNYSWENRPSWGILPFEALEPRWKVLQVEGVSPLWKGFDPESYALTIHFGLIKAGESAAAFPEFQPDSLGLPETNRDPALLTTVALTGVTALVRATAFTMRRNGLLYPGGDVREILRDADIAHISNEIPFDPGCPPPDPTQAGLVFCSDPSYIELLRDIGTDIVELTGDHFADHGPDAMRYTLKMYEEEGWPYYGGGYNLEDGRQARTFEHNGNRIAFIGCNAKKDNHYYATARADNPGAVACDFDWMDSQISQLKAQGYLVIVTFQDDEYYTYAGLPDQVRDSQNVIDAGAVIASGSQAHHPQGMQLYQGGFIHFGLGNLFFDQWGQCQDLGCDYAFIDRHVFYAGRYVSVELLPIRFIDFARPRPMTPEEAAVLLQKVFSASGW